MIEFQLCGVDFSNEWGGPYSRSLHNVTVNGQVFRYRDPATEHARFMVASGTDPTALLIVTRAGRPVFAPRPIGEWAAVAVVEREAASIRFEKYRPGEFRGGVKNRPLASSERSGTGERLAPLKTALGVGSRG